ncbi:Uncharacterized protein APZ42_003774 [Daphnia magna]|uniref:Uncharacterized protein n=1 Tax=Daphnia magna TaxID=35525 RepID=A0A164HFH3_9CRUS|nr:Uncharacterized protein APZ42_003774 [Daphnia magna]
MLLNPTSRILCDQWTQMSATKRLPVQRRVSKTVSITRLQNPVSPDILPDYPGISLKFSHAL